MILYVQLELNYTPPRWLLVQLRLGRWGCCLFRLDRFRGPNPFLQVYGMLSAYEDTMGLAYFKAGEIQGRPC